MRPAAVLVALVALLLAGCGFHLRGSTAGETPPASVVIDDQARLTATGNWLGGGPGELGRVFSETFADAGVATRDDANVRVELLTERIEKRVASVDATASAAEYQLDYTLTYRIRGSDGATLVDVTRLKLDRSYRHKADAIMGSADEEGLLQRDLRRDAALQVLRRVNRLGAGAGASEPPVAAAPSPPADASAPAAGVPDAPHP